MKKAGIALIIIGLVFMGLSPILKWAIGPAFIKIPDDIETTSVYEGVLTLFVDPDTLSLLPEDMAVKIPLTITRTNVSVPEQSTGDVALIKETATAVGPGGTEFINYTKYYALDRKTAENVPGNESDADREGFSILFGFSTPQETLPTWSDETGMVGDLDFVEETTLDGEDSEDITVHVYEGSGIDPMLEPPLGLPEELSGAEIKAIVGDPNLALADDEMFPITYLFETEATVTIEPRTGTVAKVIKEETYYVDASALGQENIKLANLKYEQTAENVRENLDENVEYFTLFDLAELWLPLASLLFGILLLLIGLGLFFGGRKQSA